MAVVVSVFVIFACFALVIYGAIANVSGSIKKRDEQAAAKRHEEIVEENKEKICREIGAYESGRRGTSWMPQGYIVSVDYNNRIVYLAIAERNQVYKVPFSHIAGCEIVKEVNSKAHTSGMYSNYGNLSTGDSYTKYAVIVKYYAVVIRLRDEYTPSVRFELIDRTTGSDCYEDGASFDNMRRFAEMVDDIIKSVAASNG